MKYEPDELHPILNAATQMIIDLYEREHTENIRKKLISLESTLSKNLDQLEKNKSLVES
ncbi:MAG: hypothetical protein HRU23_12355 [Gammaproteobacteria bacterium]|nr:hypothetical protein [Gammaproteobacteria bacterium]